MTEGKNDEATTDVEDGTASLHSDVLRHPPMPTDVWVWWRSMVLGCTTHRLFYQAGSNSYVCGDCGVSVSDAEALLGPRRRR